MIDLKMELTHKKPLLSFTDIFLNEVLEFDFYGFLVYNTCPSSICSVTWIFFERVTILMVIFEADGITPGSIGSMIIVGSVGTVTVGTVVPTLGTVTPSGCVCFWLSTPVNGFLNQVRRTTNSSCWFGSFGFFLGSPRYTTQPSSACIFISCAFSSAHPLRKIYPKLNTKSSIQ